MYARFFGLQRDPFSIAPDPRYLFMSERHREALAHLLYGLNAGGGFVLLTGEIGAGKTTVCRCFLEQIPKRCNVAYIFNPKLSVDELLTSICDEFGVPRGAAGGSGAPSSAEPTSVKGHIDPLNEYLLRTHAVGQNNVLIIDEAQNLSADVLEQLRLLTNLETSERKLLQIVLIGQPELRAKLARPELEQLAQRVVARYHLDALSADETAQYIAHRLAVAGLAGPNPFDDAALRRIHKLARGVPRRINLLCDRALLGAYAAGTPRVGKRIVEQAGIEVFGASRLRDAAASTPLRRGLAIGLAIGMGGVLAGAAAVGVATTWWRSGTTGTSTTGRAGPVALTAPAPTPVPALRLTAAASAPAPALAPAASAVTGQSSAASSAEAPARVGPAGAASAVASAASAAAGPTASVASAAAAPNPAGVAAPAGAADASSLFATLMGSEATAWRQLATRWQFATDEADVCQAASRARLQCFRGSLDPASIRQLDRPGILTLHDDAGHTAYALLTGLNVESATLRVVAADATARAGDRGRSADAAVGSNRSVPLLTLARLWRGEFATLWRTPPGYTKVLSTGSAGAPVDWLAQQLARWRREPAPLPGRPFDQRLRSALVAFQLAHDVQPDGVAGATTLMLMNHASGIDEPRLHGAAPRPAVP